MNLVVAVHKLFKLGFGLFINFADVITPESQIQSDIPSDRQNQATVMLTNLGLIQNSGNGQRWMFYESGFIRDGHQIRALFVQARGYYLRC